jgi:hypothetical protein
MKNNTIVDLYINTMTWWFLQWYFLPYRMPEFGGEVDQWIRMYSLNGICSRR